MTTNWGGAADASLWAPGAQQEPRIPQQQRVSPARDQGGPPTPPLLAENRVRGRVVDRLTLMADRHRRHREETRATRRPVGPHAVGVFYEYDFGGGPEVAPATRLFFDAAETTDLPWVLDTLIQRAGEYRPGMYDPRIHMANRIDPELPAGATLVAIGVTTVLEPAGDPASAAYASLGMNRPFRGLARMTDGTDLFLSSPGGFLAHVDVLSTGTLNVNDRRTRHWNWMPTRQPLAYADTTTVADLLPRLSTLLDYAAGRAPVTVADGGATDPAEAASVRSRHRGRPARRTGLRLRGGQPR